MKSLRKYVDNSFLLQLLVPKLLTTTKNHHFINIILLVFIYVEEGGEDRWKCVIILGPNKLVF